jgi:hypothetical protein
MVDSRKIKKEKKKIDKLTRFCSKVNTFINTRLANNNNNKILDLLDKINDITTNDKHYLKNLNNVGVNGMSSKNTALYNSPFLPGHTMAFDGKKSIPVANPLGSAALGMTNANPLSLSALSISDPAQSQAQNIMNHGYPMQGQEIDVLALSPMRIDNRASPEPPIVYPGTVLEKSRKSKYPPVSIPVSPVGAFGQIPVNIPPIAPIVSSVTPMQYPIVSSVPVIGAPVVNTVDNLANSIDSLSFIV